MGSVAAARSNKELICWLLKYLSGAESSQQVLLNFRILEPPEDVVDEVVVDVDEQHRGGEEKEHLPRVERAEHRIDFVRDELEGQPSGKHDAEREDRPTNFRVLQAAQPRIF